MAGSINGVGGTIVEPPSTIPTLAEEARKRQATSTGGANPQLTQIIAEADKGEAREQAARLQPATTPPTYQKLGIDKRDANRQICRFATFQNATQRGLVAGKIANLNKGRPPVNGSIDPFISQSEAAEIMKVSQPEAAMMVVMRCAFYW